MFVSGIIYFSSTSVPKTQMKQYLLEQGICENKVVFHTDLSLLHTQA